LGYNDARMENQPVGTDVFERVAEEREALVAALRQWGIRYLAPGDAQPGDWSSSLPNRLIARLATQADPRLRLALISLFILHPYLASIVPQAVNALDEASRVELMAGYMAATYLQRMWHIRLSFYLPQVSFLPDLFSAQMGLPDPQERGGKVGLHALAAWHAAHSPYPFNWLASYQRTMDLLFEQLKQETRQREHAPAG